jgi:hypothetical protein
MVAGTSASAAGCRDRQPLVVPWSQVVVQARDRPARAAADKRDRARAAWAWCVLAMRGGTARDRAHLAAIAAGEEQSAAERIERALAVPPGERTLEGFRLGAETPWTAAHLAELDARKDDEMELAPSDRPRPECRPRSLRSSPHSWPPTSRPAPSR